jgi:hemolysin D
MCFLRKRWISRQAAALKDGNAKNKAGGISTYKVLVSLEKQHLDTSHEKHKLVPGMQVIAEINEGQRTVLEYLLSPLQKAVRESGRER